MAGPLKSAPGSQRTCAFLIIYISLAAIFSAAISSTGRAEEQNWLQPGSSTEIANDPPAELIRPDTIKNDQWLFGRLLFRSPSLLGERAVRIGLSCNSCHPNGHMNKDFYIEGLSDRPGRIDVTHRFWQAGFDDGKANPVDIPSLRGVRDTAPYGTINVFPDLHVFTSHVILSEFAGPPPTTDRLNALVVYLNSIDINNLNAQRTVVKTSVDMSYLSLLRAPLEKGVELQIREMTDLIREEFGRQARQPNAPIESLKRAVTGLREINEKAADQDFTAALDLYNELVANQ